MNTVAEIFTARPGPEGMTDRDQYAMLVWATWGCLPSHRPSGYTDDQLKAHLTALGAAGFIESGPGDPSDWSAPTRDGRTFIAHTWDGLNLLASLKPLFARVDGLQERDWLAEQLAAAADRKRRAAG
jgi:hypothetical protein